MSAVYDLESYFAKKYTKKYCELGGSYFAGDDITPLEEYFESGEYKELEDEQLEKLYAKVSDSKYITQMMTLGLAAIVAALYYWF